MLVGGMCRIRFYNNVKSVGTYYKAIAIDITVKYFDGLEKDITQNYAKWLAFAIDSNNEN